MSKRAVLYARVSGDDGKKEGRNLEGQIADGWDYVQEKGYRIVAELAEDDRGASGADWDLPKLNEALDMARRGEFDVLIVRELDRFARGLAKQLVIEGEFKRYGVEVEYILAQYDDSPEGRLNKHIRAVIAEFEREKINQRMTRGRRLAAKKGKVMLHGNRPPYGYILEDGMLVIYEPEAGVVRLLRRRDRQEVGHQGCGQEVDRDGSTDLERHTRRL
jgi:site-specific DNA recombinase